MAYAAAGLSIGFQLIGGKHRFWIYESTDPFSTVDDTDYFALAGFGLSGSPGMREGDFVWVFDTDSDPPDVTLATVSAIDADYNATVAAVAFAGAGAFTTLATTGTTTLTDAAADLLGFHGATAVSQRASSNMATSNVVTSASYGTLQVAMLQEVMNTLNTLGLHKGAA